MKGKIKCPNCFKMNDVQKFCIYCGKRLFDDNQFKLISSDIGPHCLNCGRPVKWGQAKCVCGYELGDIECPECTTKNAYANRFCVSCGKELWTPDVFDYKYKQRIFDYNIFEEILPSELRNTSLYRRHGYGGSKYLLGDITKKVGGTVEGLRREDLKTDKSLLEIRSRWKIVSPHHCINCLNILMPNSVMHESTCPKCGSKYLGDKKRVEYLRGVKNNYSRPIFEINDFKMTSKYSSNYLGSLAPSVGESQFEYRERLKWEFAENMYRKKLIKICINHLSRPKPVVNTQNSDRLEGEWELYGMTQDAWEIQMMEHSRELREEIQDRIDRGDTFL